LSYLALLPQFIAFALGWWALRDSEREGKSGGAWGRHLRHDVGGADC